MLHPPYWKQKQWPSQTSILYGSTQGGIMPSITIWTTGGDRITSKNEAAVGGGSSGLEWYWI